MRKLRDTQSTLDFNPIHEKTHLVVGILHELLDELGLKILSKVEIDLTYRLKNPETGAPGMTAEQVLRMTLLKQMYGLSYRALRDRVEDSILLRRFAGYEFTLVPSHSTLQENIRRIEMETWEEINTALMKVARKRNIDTGEKVRIDTTGVETNIKRPTDASLLEDGVRVLTRQLKKAMKQFPGVVFPLHNRTRVCKKLLFAISNGDATSRPGDYRRLIGYAEEVVGYARAAITALKALTVDEEDVLKKRALTEEISNLKTLLTRVIKQTRDRTQKGKKVPAEQKVVSLFEEHTDILEKGKRETVFGHKVNLIIGSGALIHDMQILEGNPADSDIFMDSLISYRSKFRQVPKVVATDKGFGSGDNARRARKLGVEALTFSRRKLAPENEALVVSGRTEKLLMKFRAGAEGIISAAKRGVKLARCTWHGWDGFCSYAWSAIIAHNLKMMVAALM